MDVIEVEMDLPYPPSVNHYWVRTPHGMIIGKRGRKYREETAWTVLETVSLDAPLVGTLWMDILITMPDRRRRDVDNLSKCVLDALEHAGVYEDDSQIYSLHMDREVEPCKPGGLQVMIGRFTAPRKRRTRRCENG